MQEISEQLFTKVWAPTLVSFTRWAIESARSQSIHRLYFLARDAHMCYEIACRMVEEEHIPLEVRYLEGSRYAWRMAEFALEDTEPIEKICIGGVDVTLRKILERGGLTEGEVAQTAKSLLELKQNNDDDWLLQKLYQENGSAWLDAKLTYEQTQQLKLVLRQSGLLKKYIQGHGTAAYGATIDYLKQEGILDVQTIGIVDSGWVGTLQQTLEHLRQSHRPDQSYPPIQGYYFGLYELPERVDASTYHTYYFRPYRDIERKVRFSNCLFEAVCSAKEGMTVGYQKVHDRMMPIYDTHGSLNRTQIIEEDQMLQKLLADPNNLRNLSVSRRQVQEHLEQLMSTPNRAMVKHYGSYRFSDDVCEAHGQTLAVCLTSEELRSLHAVQRLLIMRGRIRGRLQESAWPEGSVTLTAKHVRYHLRHVRWYKRMIYMRKKLRQNKEFNSR